MTLNEVLNILNNRLIALNEARKAAYNNGDLDNVVKIDADLTTTVTTIENLKATIATTQQ